VQQAHQHAAIFDQSTFGKIRVEGTDAETFLDRVCANTMKRSPGHVIYTAMLNERGTFESDLTVLRLSDECYRLYVGTGAIKRDLSWLRRHVQPDERVRLIDETDVYAVLGLMGPEAQHIATSLGADSLNAIGYFRHRECELAGIRVTAARLSYVGEAGWELTCGAADAPRVYDALHSAGARPSGLFAQTSMRIEKRYLAMSHDLDADVTPLEAGLDFAVCWDKPFVGRDALLRRRDQGVGSRMVSLILDDAEAVPVGNEPVFRHGEIIGKTTSAAFGHRICRPVALAYLAASHTGALEDGGIEIDIAQRLFRASVSLKAAFDPDGTRLRPMRTGKKGTP
jgi:glycine cleavage system aminomethyltransferase T